MSTVRVRISVNGLPRDDWEVETNRVVELVRAMSDGIDSVTDNEEYA